MNSVRLLVLPLLLIATDNTAAARVPPLVDGRYGNQVKELSHRVLVRVHGLVAQTTVTVTLRSTSGGPEEGILSVTTPPGSVMTGLETRFAGRWVKGALLDAAAVRKTVQRTQGLPRRYDPAWLELAGINRYRLRVYPAPSKGALQVRYTYLHPITLRWGKRVFVYPRRGSQRNLSPALVTIQDRSPFGGRLRNYVIRVASKMTLEKPLADSAIPAHTPMRASLFVTPAGRDGTGQALLLVQGNPDASRRRWGTDVVFVVDRSRSMWKQSDRTLDAIVRATIRELGARTRFALVTFDFRARSQQRQLQWAQPAAVAAALKKVAHSKTANGTRILAGLREAYRLFGAKPTARRRLLVVLTDGLLPERDHSGIGWPLAPSNTEVLILRGRPFQGLSHKLRSGPLALLARQHGGVAYVFDPLVHEDGSAQGDQASHRAAGQLAASLARPGRLTQLAIRLGGAELRLPHKELPLLGGFLSYHRYLGAAPQQATLRFGFWGKRRTVAVKSRTMPTQWAAGLAKLYGAEVDRGVGPKRSLVVVHPKDAFGQDRLRFAKRWGGHFFRRMAPPGALDLAVGPFHSERGVAKAPTAGTKFSPGRLTKKIVHRLLARSYLKRATLCYQATGPHFKKGRAVLYLDLTRGEITDVWIAHSTMQDRSLHRCLVKAALSLHVVRSWGDETLYRVSYPMRFRPAKRAATELRGWRPPPKRPSLNPLRGLW